MIALIICRDWVELVSEASGLDSRGGAFHRRSSLGKALGVAKK
jgi:hypothetical protein